jgi:hypothetical protein
VQTIGHNVSFGLRFYNVRACKGFPCVFSIGVDMENAFKQWMIDNYSSFMNSMVWFAAEWVSNEITSGIYQDEKTEVTE